MEKRNLSDPLGFRSFHDYLDLALGLSPRDARAAIDLQKDLLFLPALGQTFRTGGIASRVASKLCWVAETDTEEDWLDYARRCCWKRVELSVDMLLALRGTVGWRKWKEQTGGLPPWDVPMRKLHLDWREAFGTRERARRVRKARIEAARGVCGSGNGPGSRAPGGVCGCGNGAEGGVCDRDPDLEQAAEDAEAGLPETLPSPFGRPMRLSFHAPASVARRFRSALRAIRDRFGQHLDDGQCMQIMLVHVAHIHVSTKIEERLSRYVVAELHHWVCANPNCRSFGPFHRHHRLYRSRGGGDELANMLLLCDRCHMLVHDGKMVVRGTAPDGLVYLFGLRPDGTAREAYREGIRVPELEVPEG